MLEAMEIVEGAPLAFALIPVEVEARRIREVMHPTLIELRQTLAAQGIDASGPWLTHHWKKPAEKFVFDLCIPTSQTVAPSGRVLPGLISARKIARCVHIGDYAGLPGAWGEFSRWIDAQGVQKRPDFWEIYVVGPESGLPSEHWRTELVQPLG